MQNNSIIDLIKEYQRCSNYVCSELIDHFEIAGTKEILRSRRENKIPKEGTFRKIYFSFHGVGCYFEIESDKIEVDFCEDGRVDGFDVMRLRFFWEQRKDRFVEISDIAVFTNQYNSLIKDGAIVCSQKLPNRELYYLS